VEKYLASEVIDFPIHLLATQEVNPEVQASFVVEDSTRIRNDILLPTPPVVTNSSESLSFCWANEPQVRECYLGTHNPGRLTHAAGLSVSGKSAQLQSNQTLHAAATTSSSDSHRRDHFHDFPRLMEGVDQENCQDVTL
jgi:hypothetical protein